MDSKNQPVAATTLTGDLGTPVSKSREVTEPSPSSDPTDDAGNLTNSLEDINDGEWATSEIENNGKDRDHDKTDKYIIHNNDKGENEGGGVISPLSILLLKSWYVQLL